MKYPTTDGVEIELEPLSDYLVRRHGFDPSYLAKDDGMLRLDVVDRSLFQQLAYVRRNGFTMVPSLMHFSKRLRRANRSSVRITQLIAELEYVAVAPAFAEQRENNQIGRMDILTRMARILFPSERPEIENLVIPSSDSVEPFRVGCAYRLLPDPNNYLYVQALAQYAAVVSDEVDATPTCQYFLMASLFGFTSYLYVLPRQNSS